MKISYRKCFNLGNYENEVISMEGEIPDTANFVSMFENIKNSVENLHLKSLEIDREREEKEKKAREDKEERMKAENPCWGCRDFGKCDMPMYNRVKCSKYDDSDLPF